MSVSFVIVSVVFFGLAAYLYGFAIKLMHVIDESEVIVSKRVFIVQLNALLQMFDCFTVHLSLEVC